MSKKLSVFPLITDRWISGTQYLSHKEKGWYIDLLLYLFTERKPIKDAAHACRVLSISTRNSASIQSLIDSKLKLNQHGYYHPLVNEIINNSGRIKGLGSGATPTENPHVLPQNPHSEIEIDTVTKVTGETSSPSEFDIWKIWREFLTSKSVPQNQAGILGKLIKNHGDEKTKQAVMDTIAANPADPISFIGGILKPKKRGFVC